MDGRMEGSRRLWAHATSTADIFTCLNVVSQPHVCDERCVWVQHDLTCAASSSNSISRLSHVVRSRIPRRLLSKTTGGHTNTVPGRRLSE
jgi:hypothetical protein